MCTYRIPRSLRLVEEAWIEIIRESRKDESWVPNKSTRVCSRHFPDSSYRVEVEEGAPRRLLENAIPLEGKKLRTFT